ncbi:MAG: hypothetical protein C0423_11785 [Methylibium sp.]|nr:hypothetical protein [Methylibium sp.]
MRMTSFASSSRSSAPAPLSGRFWHTATQATLFALKAFFARHSLVKSWSFASLARSVGSCQFKMQHLRSLPRSEWPKSGSPIVLLPSSRSSGILALVRRGSKVMPRCKAPPNLLPEPTRVGRPPIAAQLQAGDPYGSFESRLQLGTLGLSMKYLASRLFTLHLVLASFAASSAVAAEVYKWVDKDGKVHYSERKPPQAVGKVVDIRVPSSPHPPVRPAVTATSSSKETSGPDEPMKRKEDSGQGSSRARPKSLSGGKIDETKESKCNLARDVLSGAVKHGNGAPTDAHDRQVAENDIRLFCK